MVTVSDKKIGHDAGNGTFDYYNADVITAQDYYAYGMTQPGRNYAQGTNSYRYSINGQEKEKELNENITTAEYWEYDSRIGRRWNLDPKPTVGISQYSTFANNPILFNDIKGDTFSFPRTGFNALIFQIKFYITTGYLIKKGAGNIYEAIAKHPNTVKVVPLEGQKASYYDPLTGTLFWNSRLGIRTTNDVNLSPASVLNHELDHALNHISNYKKFTEDNKPNKTPYNTKEEERVIKGSEQETAIKLGEIKKGEVTRTDHNATDLLLTDDPTSSTGVLVPYNKKITSLPEIIIISKKKRK